MRNNNQQKRTRGRNNGNRRSQNPLTRVYESNGPDVKVRGTAQHVVEKYQQLARDAQATGDYVAAENYLQHAEHYYRIIAAAQAQFGVQGQPYQRSDDDEFDDEMDEGGSDNQPVYQAREQAPRDNGQRDNGHRDGGQRDGGQRDGNQRDGGPREGQRDFFRDRDNRRDNRERGQDRNQERGPDRNQERGPDRSQEQRGQERAQDRGQERGQDRDRSERPDRPEREPREGRWSRESRPYRDNRAPREGGDAGYRDPAQQPQPRLGPEVEAEIGLPAFITQSGGTAPVSPAAARKTEAPADAVEPKAVAAPAPVAAPVAPAPAAPVEAPPAAEAPAPKTRTRAAKPAAAVAPEEAPADDTEGRAPRTRRRRYRRSDTEGEGEGSEPAAAEVAE